MAGRSIDFDINASDNGTIDKLVSKTKTANQEFEKLKSTASSVSTGTRSGDQAMRRATAAPTAAMELDDYTTAGGVGRRRGAGARDFAAEAQGLGGLVRLYAEYAANIYAVTAAFSALQNAMQTEIMIRGMQQLGAATGNSLVGMTKEFVAATDGMVSFREAAEAVTKVTTSGMGKQQVMDIATVAKGASQALGLSMTDAVSRLSRGITKLEPELLDELGLFTKLDKAVSDYARSVGKSEGQLTDFERRQAFANAVLDEGKKKFAEIAQAGNPYDQLLANLKNVATDILSVVNTVIGPIAKILADNTGLLTAAIGLFALKIVSKVFPVLSDYRDRLDVLAKESKDKAAKIAAAAQEREVFGRTGLEAKAGVPEAKAALDAAKAREAVAREELGLANKQNMSLADRALAEQKINGIIQQRIAAEAKLKKAGDLAAELGTKPSTFSPTSYIQQQNAQRAASGAARTGIVADVSRQFETKGIRESFASLTEQIGANAAVLGRWGKATTFAAGAAAILGQGIGMIGSFLFSKLLGPLSLAITAYELLNGIFGKNDKEMRKLTDSLSQLDDATKTAIDTNQKYKNSISIDSVIAYSNSIKGLDENIQNLVKNFDSTKKAESWFDTFSNFLADLTPGWDSVEEKTSKGLGAALAAGIENIKSAPLKAELTKKYKDILKIDDKTPLTPKTIEDALNKLDGFGADAARNYKKAVEDLGVASEAANKKIQEQTLYLRGLVDAGDLATKSTQTFMNSLKDSSPLSQMLQNNIKYLSQLGKALDVEDLNKQAAAMDSISKVDLTIFGAAAIDIARMSDEFQAQKVDIDAVSASLEEQRKKLLQLRSGPQLKWYQFGETNAGRKERMGEISLLEQQVSNNERIIADFEAKFIAMRDKIAQATSQGVQQMAQTAVRAHQLELAKIKVDFDKAVVGMMPVKTESTLKLQADLDKKSIDIESRLVNSQMDLANSTDKLRLQIELLRDDQKINQLKETRNKRELTGKEEETLSKLEQRVSKGQQAYKAVESGDIATIQSMLGEFPELFDALQRRMKQVQAQAKASSDKAKVDVKLSVDTIKLKADEARAEIAFELEKTSQIISQIGSDTPEKLQAQIDFANAALDSQLQTINSKVKEQLDIINRLASTGAIDKDTAADSRIKVELEGDRARKLAESKVEQENLNRLSQLNILSVKQTNDLMIKRLEIQKQLIRGESLEAFDQINFKNEQILQLQQQIELVEAQEAARRSRQAATKFAGDVKGGSGLDGPETVMSAEDKGRLAALNAAAAGDERRVQNLVQIQGLTQSAAKEIAAYERTSRQVAINEAQLRAESAARLVIEERAFAAKDHQLKLEETRLGIQGQLGTLVGDELKIAQMNLEFRRIDNQLLIDQKRLVEEIAAAERALAEEKRKAGQTTVPDELGFGQTFTFNNETAGSIQAQANVDGLTERMKNLGDNARRAKDQIKAAFVPDPIQRFSQVWNSQVDKMTDAFMNFVETGKFSFKDLVASMLADFLKMLVRMQMEAMMAAALKAALAFLGFGSGGTFSGGTATGGSSFNSYVNAGGFAKGGAFGSNMKPYAMGGAFNQGMEAYAKGGMFSVEGYAKGGSFSNKVVDSPTVFKFAQGGAPNRLGVMGEAGPEAIMPLKRMSSGNLGVESGGSGTVVDIKVNNYSGQEATTKETTDSRGNRNIEITIGDMVSGEVTRNNSSVQNSITNTFGMKPQLIRR